jgi:hypothetical protein
MEYLISRDGHRDGPYSAVAIQSLRAEGRVLDTDLCWTEGMPGWQLVVNVFDHVADDPEPEPAIASSAGPLAPPPPSLHWFVVLALSALTLGIFGWFWMFVQAAWVRTFDRGSRATPLLVVGLLTAVTGGYLASRPGAGDQEAAALVELLGTLTAGLFLILAAFRMRGSIEHHFTHVEPMNVSINSVMTFFFTFIYLQYHLNRIAEARRRNPGDRHSSTRSR